MDLGTCFGRCMVSILVPVLITNSNKCDDCSHIFTLLLYIFTVNVLSCHFYFSPCCLVSFAFTLRLQSIELRNKMFAKELRRGQRQASKPQISTATRTSFCFDGHELTLNYLTYQMCDLTYPPLAQIVNNPSNVKPFVTVTLNERLLTLFYCCRNGTAGSSRELFDAFVMS